MEDFTLRDLIAIPFFLLFLFMGIVTVFIGGRFTAKQMIDIFTRLKVMSFRLK